MKKKLIKHTNNNQTQNKPFEFNHPCIFSSLLAQRTEIIDGKTSSSHSALQYNKETERGRDRLESAKRGLT